MSAPTNSPITAEDARVRQSLFWCVAVSAVTALAAAHWLQNSYRYDANVRDPSTGSISVGTVRHGSYGSFLPRPTTAGATVELQPVVLLGNSVYAACGIVERMQRLAEREQLGIEYVNRAQTGSAMHDHMLQMLAALQLRPRLLVVAFFDLACTPDFRSWTLPRFRTDADQMAFDPAVLATMPWSFLRREFSFATALDCAVATAFPWRRLDPIVRHDVDRALYWPIVNTLGVDPVPLRVLFPLPTLNLVQDWVDRRDTRTPVPPTVGRPWPELRELFTEFVATCGHHGVPVLFLRQECGPEVALDVLPTLREVCAQAPHVRIVDRKGLWSADHYLDEVHPQEEARDAYAVGHHESIVAALRELVPESTKRR